MNNEWMISLYIALTEVQAGNIKADFERLSAAEKALFLKKLDWLLNEIGYEEVELHAKN